MDAATEISFAIVSGVLLSISFFSFIIVLNTLIDILDKHIGVKE